VIIDARSLSLEETFEAEVCIVGSGPAGITLAREFANQNFRVCLVESGGLELDQETQSLCDGKVIGDPYPDLREGRRRQFGGTAHAWEAPIGYDQYGWRCLTLDEIDFEQRDWLPYSGWPFTKSHLDPFYQRAHQVCKIGPFTYRVEDWEQSTDRPLPFKGNRVITTMSQYASRFPFTYEYREEIKRTDNITTLLYANVVEIETDETEKTVTRLRVKCLQDKQFWVSAKNFILATGGIENARLLLLSNRQQKTGLGNQHDLVGRFFMERPIVSCGMLVPNSRQLFDQTGLYDIVEVKGVPVMARIKLTEETMHRERLLNNGAQLFPKPQPYQKEAAQSLRLLLTSIRRAELSEETLKHLSKVIRGWNYVSAAGFWAAIRRLPGLHRGDWSYHRYEKKRFSMFEVIYQIEQAPDPNNRVVLSNERDCLGQNKMEIHWRLNDIDLHTIKRVQEIWAEEFDKAELGKLQINKELKFEKLAMYHHMGTTRMHNDPKQGVVDADCRVHGISNLFIAGSSVFPTAGYANPTLTIIALALRLADHIKKLMHESLLLSCAAQNSHPRTGHEG
jgi:choline dehydrogenase-like flavoprotein